MRRRRVPPFLFPLIIIFVICLLLFGLGSWLFSSERDAQAVVEDFYTYEAAGEFSNSWVLLHPFMQERFSKTAYIQDRTHVFIGHFGAETFTYTIGEGEKVEGWKMEKDRSPFDKTYKYLVTQHYKGKYGKFNFQQEVYVTKHKDNWKIVWDYNE
ncbi:hypothetical protein SAMN05192533_104269 [Mesobacillus persicus]|uniref:DUF4878 domain-containing protein n=1 Tax=Mesobacillus persicus TaxID=930146 RepID=A0A1H8A709_9BACI|nr:hypothetical protein [Mesobacillus persicus]SEM66266.1 hypothetical protein SAMN05192533_104269 [Mesobacillus persicus]